ncbi:hypothetical protein [Streptomyces sp. YIM 121038]|nr:hypothetical protein [Streptomyces sp. YIM 121038]
MSWKYAARSRGSFFLPCGFVRSLRISNSIEHPSSLGYCDNR